MGNFLLSEENPELSVLKFPELRKGKVARVKRKIKMKSAGVS